MKTEIFNNIFIKSKIFCFQIPVNVFVDLNENNMTLACFHENSDILDINRFFYKILKNS